MLDVPTWQAMGHAVNTRFRYGLLHECVDQGDMPKPFAEAILEYLRDWGFTGRATQRDLALWWTTKDGAEMLRQDWAQAELAASRAMPDEVRSDRLRNLADDLALARQHTGESADAAG